MGQHIQKLPKPFATLTGNGDKFIRRLARRTRFSIRVDDWAFECRGITVEAGHFVIGPYTIATTDAPAPPLDLFLVGLKAMERVHRKVKKAARSGYASASIFNPPLAVCDTPNIKSSWSILSRNDLTVEVAIRFTDFPDRTEIETGHRKTIDALKRLDARANN